MSAALISYLRSCGARRILYVSCNATTQVKLAGCVICK